MFQLKNCFISKKITCCCRWNEADRVASRWAASHFSALFDIQSMKYTTFYGKKRNEPTFSSNDVLASLNYRLKLFEKNSIKIDLPPPKKKETVLRSPKGKVFDRTGPPAPFLFKKMNRNGQSGPLFSLNRQTARKPSKKQRRRRGRRVKRLSDQKDTNDFRRENGEPKKKQNEKRLPKKKQNLSNQLEIGINQERIAASRENWVVEKPKKTKRKRNQRKSGFSPTASERETAKSDRAKKNHKNHHIHEWMKEVCFLFSNNKKTSPTESAFLF